MVTIDIYNFELVKEFTHLSIQKTSYSLLSVVLNTKPATPRIFSFQTFRLFAFCRPACQILLLHHSTILTDNDLVFLHLLAFFGILFCNNCLTFPSHLTFFILSSQFKAMHLDKINHVSLIVKKFHFKNEGEIKKIRNLIIFIRCLKRKCIQMRASYLVLSTKLMLGGSQNM